MPPAVPEPKVVFWETITRGPCALRMGSVQPALQDRPGRARAIKDVVT